MNNAGLAVAPPPTPKMGLKLVENGNNSCVTLNDAAGNVKAVLIYFNGDSGKIKANVGTLDPDQVGNLVQIDPLDSCLIVTRPV